jgi:hypothetical protein
MRTLLFVATGVLATALNGQAQSLSQARAECNTLARAALPLAQEMLRTHGEFPPYGVGLTVGKEAVALSADADDLARSSDRLAALRDSLAKAMNSRRLQATALVYEARLTLPSSRAPTDAIAISLTHRDGYAAVAVYPYQLEGDEVKLGAAHVIEQKEPPRPASAKRRK